MSDFFDAITCHRSDRQLLAAWVIEGGFAGAKALFVRNGERFVQVCLDEAFPAECAEEILRRSPQPEDVPAQQSILEYGNTRIFLEQITEGRRLVICGAGHVALSVIKLGVMLGFEVTVIEDREMFAEKAKAAGAHRVICRPFKKALDEIPGDLTTAFVIMTREHTHDVDCLRRILQKPYVYAGMMGSRSRTGSIRELMLQEGFDARKIEQLHMPIGLPVGARTPEEIAVSVAAELVAVMNAADTGEGFPAGMPEELAALEREEGMSGVLAMIVEKSGEAPRRPGTKMLVRKDGTFLGTVGGGYAEALILKAAGEMILEECRESRLIRISMKKGTTRCGGKITVFLLPV